MCKPPPKNKQAAVYHKSAQVKNTAGEKKLLLDSGQSGSATFGLRECQDSQAVPVIRAALADPVPYVQYIATMSLLELLEESCLPEVAELIKQTSGAAREHIVRGFFQATNHLNIDVAHNQAADQVFDALATALSDDLPATRMAVMWPLAWLDHERARSLLRQAYEQEQDGAVKAHIIHVTVNLLSPLGKELLEDGLRSHSERVREMAEQIRADIEAGAIVVGWLVSMKR